MSIVAVTSGSAELVETARLFAEYLVHYGQRWGRDAAGSWLDARLAAGSLQAWLAEPAAGFITVAVTPASLALGDFWQVRDLYVETGARGRGIGRRLMDHVIAAAARAGATRIAVQTEVDNEAALSLYRSLGFEPVEGIVRLSRPASRP